MNQGLCAAAAKGLFMTFARSDLRRSVVESSLLSLNEYTSYCLATLFTAISMIAHPFDRARERDRDGVSPSLLP